MTTIACPTRVDYEILYAEDLGGIAVLTINRPEVRNAVNRQVQPDIRPPLTPSAPTTRWCTPTKAPTASSPLIIGRDVTGISAFD